MNDRTLWVAVDAVMLATAIVNVIISLVRPKYRSYMLGSLLIGIGIVCATVDKLWEFQPPLPLAFRILSVIIAAAGLLLIERQWRVSR